MESISAVFGLQVGLRIETDRAEARATDATRAQVGGYAAAEPRVIAAEIVGAGEPRRRVENLNASTPSGALERRFAPAQERPQNRARFASSAGAAANGGEFRGVYARSGGLSVSLIPLSARTIGQQVDLYA